MKKKILLSAIICAIICITIIVIININKIKRLKEFKETLNDIIESAGLYYDECNCDLFGDGPLDLKSSEIKFKNSESIKEGELTSMGKTIYVIEITDGEFCANGILDSYDIYKGECSTGAILEDNYSKSKQQK